VNVAARVDKRGNPATRSAQLAQDFGFKGEVPITESQVVIMVGKPGIEEAIKRKAVFSPVAMGHIVEEDNVIWTVNLTEQAKQLAPEGTEADKAYPLHFVATELRYLKTFRETGRRGGARVRRGDNDRSFL
jgi:hypothetical protein